MNRVLRTAVAATAVASTTFAALPAAHADDWRWHHHSSHHGDAVAAGVLGLAAGALIGGALANDNPPPPEPYYDGYYVQRRVVVPRPAPVRQYYAYSGFEPWTPAWYRYCSNRYQSFDARTGTFTGFDGQQLFCVAN
jgi:hypothetical protein